MYTCFVSCHYCPCPAFSCTVLRRNHGLLVSLNCATLKTRLVAVVCPVGIIKRAEKRSPIRRQTKATLSYVRSRSVLPPPGQDLIWSLRGIFGSDRPLFALNISERASLVQILV